MVSYSNYEEYLRHPLFLRSVEAARTRAGGRCENDVGWYNDGPIRCKRAAIDPHHTRYCKWGRFDPPENLLMVCRQCHEKLHTCSECGEIIKGKELEEMLDRDGCRMHRACWLEMKTARD